MSTVQRILNKKQDRPLEKILIAEFLIGATIMTMPSISYFVESDVAVLNCVVTGFAIVAISIGSLIRRSPWKDVSLLVAATWLTASPWALSYYDNERFAIGQALLGALLFTLIGCEMALLPVSTTPRDSSGSTPDW